MGENFPNIGKEKDFHFQETVSSKMSWKRSTPRYSIIKMAKVKDKEENLKCSKKKKKKETHTKKIQ